VSKTQPGQESQLFDGVWKNWTMHSYESIRRAPAIGFAAGPAFCQLEAASISVDASRWKTPLKCGEGIMRHKDGTVRAAIIADAKQRKKSLDERKSLCG
jgi:hypothetical protein